MSMCRVVSCVVGRRCLLWPVCSLDKTLFSFVCFILYSKAKLACCSRYLLTSYFCIPIPYDENDIFFLQLVLEDFVGLPRTGQLQPFWHQWLGHRLDYCDIECLLWKQTKIILFLILHPSTAFSDTFVDYEGYSISCKGFMPTAVDTVVICIKFAHSWPCYFTDS